MVRINFTREKDDWKKFGRKNVIIALNILYSKKEKIYPACVLKHNLKLEKQVILLMLPNEKGWHYLAAKKKQNKKTKQIALWRGITSKHHGDFYCLNCLHSFATENKRESHKKVCQKIDFCNIIKLFEDTKI